MSRLLDLHKQITTCKDCHHFKEHWKFSHDAHGKCRSGIMVVGESSHKPSIDAGKYYASASLRSILESVLDIDQECYLTDLAKCDKSFLESKDDIEEAARSCSRYLYEEINLIKPIDNKTLTRIKKAKQFDFQAGWLIAEFDKQNKIVSVLFKDKEKLYIEFIVLVTKENLYFSEGEKDISLYADNDYIDILGMSVPRNEVVLNVLTNGKEYMIIGLRYLERGVISTYQ